MAKGMGVMRRIRRIQHWRPHYSVMFFVLLPLLPFVVVRNWLRRRQQERNRRAEEGYLSPDERLKRFGRL